MRSRCAIVACSGIVALAVAAVGSQLTQAQPAASFLAKCSRVQIEMSKLDFRGDPLITIQVSGPLREVRHGNPVLLSICDLPSPRIVCVTYNSDSLTIGSEIIVSGSIARRSPKLVVLDPCLHYPPDKAPTSD